MSYRSDAELLFRVLQHTARSSFALGLRGELARGRRFWVLPKFSSRARSDADASDSSRTVARPL